MHGRISVPVWDWSRTDALSCAQGLRSLLLNPVSQCVMFSYTTLGRFIAKGSTKLVGGNFSRFS